MRWGVLSTGGESPSRTATLPPSWPPPSSPAPLPGSPMSSTMRMRAAGIANDFTLALKRTPNAVLQACASRSQATADEYAAKHGFVAAYASYEVMLPTHPRERRWCPVADCIMDTGRRRSLLTLPWRLSTSQRLTTCTASSFSCAWTPVNTC